MGTSNFTSHFHLNPFMMDATHSCFIENAVPSQVLYQYDFSCKLSGWLLYVLTLSSRISVLNDIHVRYLFTCQNAELCTSTLWYPSFQDRCHTCTLYKCVSKSFQPESIPQSTLTCCSSTPLPSLCSASSISVNAGLLELTGFNHL